MKNLFLEKNFVQKLIIAVIVIVLFNFSAPTICHAEGFVASVGGELLTPVLRLIVAVADGIMSILQDNFIGEVDIIASAKAESLGDMGTGMKFILLSAGIIVIGASIIAIPFAVVGISLTVTSLAAAVTVGTVTICLAGESACIAARSFVGKFDIPQLVYSPFAIFANMVPMFDINFFEPKTINVHVYTAKEQIIKAQNESRLNKLKENETNLETLINSFNDNETDKGKLDQLLVCGAYVSELSTEYIFSLNYDLIDAGQLESIKDNETGMTNIMGNWMKKGLLFSSNPSGVADSIDSANKSDNWALIIYNMCSVAPDDKEKNRDIDMENISEKIGNAQNAQDIGIDFYTLMFRRNDCSAGELDKPLDVIESEELKDQYAYENLKKYGVKKYKSEIMKLYEETLNYIPIETEIFTERQVANAGSFSRDYAEETPAKKLHDTIGNWYTDLRNLALVILLVILVYIGIRIVISSTAPEKAKYKQMITNWVVAIFILAFMHFIMVAVINVTETISQGLSKNCTESIVIPLPQGMNELNGEVFVNEEKEEIILTTNFVGYIRYLVGIFYDGALLRSVGYFVMYIMLVTQTCMFTWVYAKRVVYMAFLTIIAPLVAITYPIDKIGDGKSQAFDMWMKEYIFNALLQPIHLLIYTILCGSALELMVNSPIYGIVALAFVVPAEKFIRKMFGFEKAQTPSALGGAAGAALAMTGIQKIGNMIRPDGKDDRDADKQPKSHRIRQANVDEQKGHDNNLAKGREKVLNTGKSKANNTNGNSKNDNDGDTKLPAPNLKLLGNNAEENPIGTGTEGASENDTGNVVPETGTEGASENDTGNVVPETGTGETSGSDTSDVTPEVGTDGNSTNNNNADAQQNSDNIDLRQAAIDQADRQAGQSVSSEKEKAGKRFKRAVGKIWDMDRARLANQFTYKKNMRRIRRVGRGAGGAVFGAGTALTMAAIKMAMGSNAGDVVNTAIAGGTAGYAIGSKATQKAQEFVKTDEHVEAAVSGWSTAEENKKRINKQAIKEWKNNEDNRDVFREAGDIGGYDWKELMNSDFTEQCLKFGLQDPEDIVAAYDYMNSEDFQKTYGLTEDEGGNLTEQERRSLAIQAAKDAHIYGDIRHDQKKLDEMRSRKQHLFSEDENGKKWAREQNAAQVANRRTAQANYNRAQEAYNAKVNEAEAHASETSVNEDDRTLFAANKEIKDAQEALEKEQRRQQQMSEDQITKNEEAKRRIAQLQDEIAKEANEYDGNREAFNALVAKAETDDPEVKRIREEIARKDTEIQEARGRRAAKSEVDAIIAQKREMERQYKQRNSALADEENALRKVESELESKRRKVKRLEKTPSKISKDQKARNDAEIARLKGVIKEKEDAKQSLLQGRFSQEYDVVKATKKAVSDAKVQSVEDLHKTFVDTMVDQSMKQFFDVYTQKDKYTN